MIWTFITSIVTGAVGTLAEIAKGWQDRKRVQLESEVKLAQAKVEAQINYMRDKQAADIALENLSIGYSGWKDEWFVLLLSIPAVLCFIPGFDVHVFKGFESLKNCPDWYSWMLGIAVGSSFGYRKIADFMATKKGA
jgi:hypothetical protein